MTLPLIFPDDAARARASDPVSSHEAADATSDIVWASHQSALEIMRAHGKPMTALQIELIAQARELPHSPSRMRSCPKELEGKGLTFRDGFTNPERGRRRQLWSLTEEGRRA